MGDGAKYSCLNSVNVPVVKKVSDNLYQT